MLADMYRLNRATSTPRFAACRRALRGTPMQVPAELLTRASVADFVRRRGVGVDVSSADALRLALDAGLPPDRVAAQCGDVAAVDAALEAGVGRLVIGSWAEVMLVTARQAAPPSVLVDVTDSCGERLSESTVAAGRLDVVGLRCRVGGDRLSAGDAVRRMMEQMARLRRAHGVILTRACVSGYGRADADPQDLRRGVHRLQLTIEEACADLRYPRPALVLSLDAAALAGA